MDSWVLHITYVLTLGALFMGVVLIVNGSPKSGFRGRYWWALSTIVLSLSLLGFEFQETLPGIVGIALSNTFMIAVTSLSLRGLDLYVGRNRRVLWYVAPAIIGFLVTTIFTYALNSVVCRIISSTLISLFTIVLVLLVAIPAFREKRTKGFAFLSGAYLAVGLGQVARLLLAFFDMDRVAVENTGIEWTVTLSGSFLVLVAAFVGYNLLISERRDSEFEEDKKKLERIIADRDAFMAIIAHDLRGPIGSVAKLLETLAEEGNEMNPDLAHEYLVAMEHSSRDISQLLENLLVWAVASKQEIPFAPLPVMLRPLVDESAGAWIAAMRVKGIRLIDHVGKDLLVIVDADQVKTILRNLISNAVKFCDSEGQIEIGTRLSGGDLVLYVWNSGEGMSREILAMCQGEGKIKSSRGTAGEKGLGLGLSICKTFAERHGGIIEMKSEPGKGCEASLRLPGERLVRQETKRAPSIARGRIRLPAGDKLN